MGSIMDILTRPYRLQRELDAYIARLEDMRRASSIASSRPSLGHSRAAAQSSPVERYVISMEGLDERIHAQEESVREARAVVERLILPLEPEERTILTLRHLAFSRWADICAKLSYSPSSVHRLHVRAIASADKNLQQGRDISPRG